MPTEAESLCCHEIDKVLEKMEDHDGYVNCVTEIPDFSTVFTEREVLRSPTQARLFQHSRHVEEPGTGAKLCDIIL